MARSTHRTHTLRHALRASATGEGQAGHAFIILVEPMIIHALAAVGGTHTFGALASRRTGAAVAILVRSQVVAIKALAAHIGISAQ